MSIELANEKWIDGHEDGLLGQFASTQGYTDLVSATRSGYWSLARLFRDGVSEDVAGVQKQLKHLIAKSKGDVASTAKALLDLTEGQKILIITNGGN